MTTLPAAPPPLPATEPAGHRPLPGWARAASDAVDVRELAERVVEADISAAFEPLRGNHEFVTTLRASVHENVAHLRRVLSGRAEVPEVELTAPLELAALQARLRIPQTDLQRSYRVGFAAMWQEWSDRLVERAELDDVPRAESLQALREMTSLLLGYQHHVASRVADCFARADDAMSRSRDHVRHGLVRHLLRDEAPPLAPSDLVLIDYPLDADHVTVMLPTTPEAEARRMVGDLREVSHTRDTLLHPVDLTGTAVFLARPRPVGWRRGAVDALAARLRERGVVASVSEPHRGVLGLRAGWHQVQDVERVRSAWGVVAGPSVLAYTDVSLEILLMADPEKARGFVRAELGALGADDDVAARLRETVEASHRFGRHVTTAEHLHLHEHTVRNRLQKAAELLGRPLGERRTELQVALRLIRLLESRD